LQFNPLGFGQIQNGADTIGNASKSKLAMVLPTGRRDSAR